MFDPMYMGSEVSIEKGHFLELSDPMYGGSNVLLGENF